MVTPRRKLILDDYITALSGITIANGYKTTVVTVERVIKSWEGSKPGEKPSIGILPQREDITHEPSQQMRVDMTVVLVCHVIGTSAADRYTKLNDLLDDVIVALNFDTSRNGQAVSTTIVSVETDEGDDDALGDGTMVVHTRCVFYRTTAAS